MLIFDRKLEVFSFVLIGAMSVYDFIGTMVIHVLYSRLSQQLHSTAELLISFSAAESAYQGKQKMGRNHYQRTKITFWTHTMRLLTVKRYGITYGSIGALVTMKYFAKAGFKKIF